MKRKKLPADRSVRAQLPMNQPNWRSNALALAAAVLLGAWASDAAALALGRVNVQSALGEPLRADIEIVDINADEASSLRTAVASPEAFRAAGLEYSPALTGIEVTLKRRPDGRYFLQLSSQRPINEPFVDLILETQWASGRIVRDYTLLFDPANMRQSTPPAAAQVAPVAPQARTSPATVAPAARATQQAPASTAAAKGDGKQVKVQSGDTAGKIAAANKPANVSLDQMLVALLNANPEAFIGGNVNLLKAGAVLELPSAELASQQSAAAASQTVIAQSRDFNEYRRRLAAGIPTTKIPATERQASGKVEAQVQDKKPAAPSPDKLTLSKGAVQGKAAEDKIAREREAKDAAVRLAELNKNITDLNQLSTGAPAVAPAAAASKPAAGTAAPAAAASAMRPAASVAIPAIAVPATMAAATKPAAAPAPAPATPAGLDQAGPAAVMPASAPVPAMAAAPASAPAAETAAPASNSPADTAKPATGPATAAKAAPKPIAPPVEEPSFIEELAQNPLVLGAVALIVALLAGFGFYKVRQRKKATQVDSSFLESRLQPDSFFGASGGQRIDTNEGGATGSSMVYSPSQLDAAGDVDPVAEADVYLAYGRDLQAEEILKEAMRASPERLAIRTKLLEVYAKRRDTKGFELLATQLFGLTGGQGEDWAKAQEIGVQIDPDNV